MQIDYSSTFNRAYKKRIQSNKDLKQLLQEKLTIFQKDPYHPSLRTHKLSGKLDGLFSQNLNYAK